MKFAQDRPLPLCSNYSSVRVTDALRAVARRANQAALIGGPLLAATRRTSSLVTTNAHARKIEFLQSHQTDLGCPVLAAKILLFRFFGIRDLLSPFRTDTRGVSR